jgi:hypothetical protein
MSFMPNVATPVELMDGRFAWVSKITPRGDDDRVVFNDGHTERIDEGQIKSLAYMNDEPPLGFRFREDSGEG